MASSSALGAATPSSLSTLLDTLNASSPRTAAVGTGAELRRALELLEQSHSSAESKALLRRYALSYRAVLSESTLEFLHLSKSGGTGLCELAKLNGCTRAAAALDTFGGNCVNRDRQDGPWWMPDAVLARIHPPGLQTFAQRSFRVMPQHFKHAHSCRNRGRQAPLHGPNARWLGTHLAPAFFSIEGGAPEARRCAGVLELLLLRAPLSRLPSFGRELHRWGLLPKPHADCDALPRGERPSKQEKVDHRAACDALKWRVCSNFSLMASMAPPVYDNQLVRALLGYDVYRLPFGAITEAHYLLARERLRKVDLLVMLDGRMERSLLTRLGWNSRGLDPKYKRKSTVAPRPVRKRNHGGRALLKALRGAARGTGRGAGRGGGGVAEDAAGGSGVAGSGEGADDGAGLAMCALSGSEAELARRVNQWDLKLYDEGRRLETLDQTFFERAEVQAVLAPHGLPDSASGGAVGGGAAGGAAAEAAVGSVAGCGLLSEGVSMSHASVSAQAAHSASTSGAAPYLGPAPICVHKRFRNSCCWGVGATTMPVPMPQLPWPSACVLPPAGRLSAQTSVRMPVAPFKHHHASCALSCAGYDRFGLENAGSFCMCLSATEAAAATPLSERECHTPCSSAGRIHRTLFGPQPLPCGGSEAVAVFETRQVLDAMGRGAMARERSKARSSEMCQPMTEPCADAGGSSSPLQATRTLYVHAPKGRGGSANGLVPDQRVILGCYLDAALQRFGVSRPPAVPLPPARQGAGGGSHDEVALRCSRGCAAHAFFAVGSERLVGGPCLCGEMALVEWKRDAEGMEPLKKRTLKKSS